MQTSELDFEYPEGLVATHPAGRSRIMVVCATGECQEQTWPTFLSQFAAEDLLIVNDTRVLRARVMAENGLEVLFIKPVSPDGLRWDVLFPSRRLKT
jgi:S-adenosylmethionine:tRNA-ribosyltransferase-isomerase (queuine synthetase)